MSCSAILLPLSAALLAAQQSSAPADLDATVARVMAEQHVVGASVLVAKDGRVLLHNGYGLADLGLDVPTKDETVYHIVGPMLPFTGVAVMQLVERGKLALDDDISKYVPEFPLQGRRVTVRQLLDHTSGIVDYHYLGDPIEATSRQPKALDEVMALYAGKHWVNEPGAKWDWSISGFQLLVTIVERVSGQSFADYVQQNLFEPAGLEHTTLLRRLLAREADSRTRIAGSRTASSRRTRTTWRTTPTCASAARSAISTSCGPRSPTTRCSAPRRSR